MLDMFEVCVSCGALFALLHITATPVCAFQEAGGWSQPPGKDALTQEWQPWLMLPSLYLQERTLRTRLGD